MRVLLGEFSKLRKATVSFVMYVRPSIRPSVRNEQLGYHWTDFHKTRYLRIFRISVENIKNFIKIWHE